jgi:hypothetical protein
MKDLFIDFAATRPEQHPERRAIERLQTGDLVQLGVEGHRVVLTREGITVGRLSKTAAAGWIDRLSLVLEARVVAMVRRYRRDLEGDAFLARCHGEYWEVPLVELCWRAQPSS